MFGRGVVVVVVAAALLVRVNLCTCFIGMDILRSVCFWLDVHPGEMRNVRGLVCKLAVDNLLIRRLSGGLFFSW